MVLAATLVIEAGVDLDFDAGAIELTPCRSLEQTMGRINRKHERDSKVVIVDALDEGWKLLEEEEYLREARERLKKSIAMSGAYWEDISQALKELDEKYTGQKLSAHNLVDAYGSPYSKMLATSLYSLFHLEGTFLEHLLTLSKKEYESRGALDIIAEV